MDFQVFNHQKVQMDNGHTVWYEKYAHSSSETIEANFLIYSFKQQHLFEFSIPGSFGPLVLDSKRSCNMVNTTT